MSMANQKATAWMKHRTGIERLQAGEIPSVVYCSAPAVMHVVDRQKMQLAQVISTNELNRNGHRVMQDGWDFEDYLRNPIVLFGHDDSKPAIGKNVSLAIDGPLLRAVTEFAPTEFGRELFALYDGGYMKAWSVGFQPTVTEYVKDAQGNISEVVFKHQKLLEYSAVAIPANANAVNNALRNKVISESTFSLLQYAHAETPEEAPSEDAPESALEVLAPVRMALSAYLTRKSLE